MSAYYMSFADANRPMGQQWLGGCYVQAASEFEAVTMSHMLGINPGGEIAIVGPIPTEAVKPRYLDRLLTSKQDIEAAAAP